MLTVLIPTHKGGTIPGSSATPQILETIASLRNQTIPPDKIVVLINNCHDDAPELARAAGVDVQMVPANPHKKAGALNWWLNNNLKGLDDQDLILVMDADSALDKTFIESAMKYVHQGYHAIGGVFMGKDGGGFVGMLQRNEYARYARDVARRKGKTLVLTGTATVFTVRCLRDVIRRRQDGSLPNSAINGQQAEVYDTKALTEDNELTFALLHIGYAIIAPPECGLRTEVMETWPDLARQRERWKRGAIENNRHYGLTRHTWNYWRLQIWGQIGILVTIIYLSTLIWALASGNLHLQLLWLAVTAIYAIERFVTVVKRRGLKQAFVGLVLVIEMPYDIFLQAVQLKAILSSTFKTRASW